jgi:hypothetical protein
VSTQCCMPCRPGQLFRLRTPALLCTYSCTAMSHMIVLILQMCHGALRNGLDYLVAEAKNYGIRLLLSLTNGDTGFGGMEQYVKWARNGRKGGRITDFYASKELRVHLENLVLT